MLSSPETATRAGDPQVVKSIPLFLGLNVVFLAVFISLGWLGHWGVLRLGRRARTAFGQMAVYGVARIVFWACCEASTFFALITMIMHSRVWPFILPAMVSASVQIALFPRYRLPADRTVERT
jgi:hypothetical protein